MPTRILIVDDSPSVCRMLTAFLRTDPDFEIVGTALRGEQALTLLLEKQPDLVTLDLDMPGMSGLDTLQRIMTERPTPVIMMTGVGRTSAKSTVRALDLGAVDFLMKYIPGQDSDPEDLKEVLIKKIRIAAKVKVIRHIATPPTQPRTTRWAFDKPTAELLVTPPPHFGAYPMAGVVAIGASTGGPTAIRDLLSGLATDFPAAVVIVQHMPATFTKALAEQLDQQTPLTVCEAQGGERLRPGFAYVAPGDRHLTIGTEGRIRLDEGPKEAGHRPSVNRTMHSVASIYGKRATGVLLSGMGEDGAAGLLAIKAAGGTTYAQDEATCAVFGMPKRAIENGAVEIGYPPAVIAEKLMDQASRNRKMIPTSEECPW